MPIILEAAMRQMSRRGVAATLLKDVAAELGVTRMALYRYVGDREDLVKKCYLRSCEILNGHLDAAIAWAPDSAEVVAQFIRRVLAPGEPEPCAVVEIAMLSPSNRRLVGTRFQAVIAKLSSVLSAGAAQGSIRPCDYAVAARAILNAVFWTPVADLWNTAKYDHDRATLVDTTVDFILHGWATDRSSIPTFAPIDLTLIAPPAVQAFDREALTEARRERILAVASRLFNEKGIDSTTLEDVAKELGATSGAISHHVGDKPRLVAECYVRMLQMGIVLLRESATRPGLALSNNAAFQHAWARTQILYCPLMPLTGFESLPPIGQKAFHDLVQPLAGWSIKQSKLGIEDGSMRALHPYALRLQTGIVGWVARAAGEIDATRADIPNELAAFVAVGIKSLDKRPQRAQKNGRVL